MVLTTKNRSFPLEETSVEANVGDYDATVTHTQTFTNPGYNQPNNDNLEAFYKFPLQRNATVFSFKTRFLSSTGKELRELKGKAKKNEVATKEYENALRSGKAAQLLEQDFDTSPDLFNLSVGSIASDVKTIIVEIGYFVPLNDEPKSKKEEAEEKEFLIDPEDFDDKIKAIKRFVIPAEMIKRGKKKKRSTKKIAFQAKVNISQSYIVSEVESPSHKIKQGSKTINGCKKTVVIFKDKDNLSKDFVLLISAETSPDSKYLIQDRNRTQTEALAKNTNNAFRGSFGDSTIAKLSFRCLDHDTEIPKQNFVFLVDRSSSMGGSKMESCRKALEMCLMSLPTKYMFNICSFGKKFKYLFSESQEASEENVEKALEYVGAMRANMRRTKILPPLKEIIAAERLDMPNVILILTDGEVGVADPILEDVQRDLQTHKVKLFTCGIGCEVSDRIINGLAKMGGGTATFITENEDFKTKLLWQMEQGVYAPFTNLKVEMGDLKLSKADLAWDLNSMLPSSVLSREILSYYVAVDISSVLEIEKKIDLGHPVESIKLTGIKGTEKRGKRVVIAEITFQNELNASGKHMIIPALCEQVRLAELSEKEESVDRAVTLSLIGNLVSKFTSLVAIENNNGAEPVQNPNNLRNAIQKKGVTVQGKNGASLTRNMTRKSYKHSMEVNKNIPKESFARAEPNIRPDEIVSSNPWVPASPLCTTEKKRDLGSSDYKKAEPLIALQNIDGSFEATAELAKLIGKESFGEHENTPGFGTAVAIAIMQEKLGTMHPGWKLFCSKAIRYLENTVTHHENVIEQAMDFILENKPLSSAEAFLHDFN